LAKGVGDFCARGLGKAGEFGERIFFGGGGSQADQDGPFFLLFQCSNFVNRG